MIVSTTPEETQKAIIKVIDAIAADPQATFSVKSGKDLSVEDKVNICGTVMAQHREQIIELNARLEKLEALINVPTTRGN
jgi:hypothetical protein